LARQEVRRLPTVWTYFERLRRGDPERKKIAIVATAHNLAQVMLALQARGDVAEDELGR